MIVEKLIEHSPITNEYLVSMVECFRIFNNLIKKCLTPLT